MFFPERIRNIEPTDRVLEIGPGGSPHPRSDVLLEKNFHDQAEAKGQRGHAPELKTDKKIVFYDGGRFPFQDKEFDYVICSHVIEHIEDVDNFIAEIVRVGNKGYLEYPTIYYEYIYNFPEHKTFVLNKNNVIYWISKEESGLDIFCTVNKFFYESLLKGYSGLVNDLKVYFFQGFEWYGSIQTKKVKDISLVCYDMSEIDIPKKNDNHASFKKRLLDFFQLSRTGIST
jgi:SAM-dependent methyltransferase